MSVGDFNGDGKLDLVTSDSGLTLLLGNGDGRLDAGAAIAGGTSVAVMINAYK